MIVALLTQLMNAAGEAATKVADQATAAASKGAAGATKVAEAATKAAEATATASAEMAGKAAEAGADGAAAAGSSWLEDMLHSGAMGYMIEGGIFMWPILILGILALGVIIERYRSLSMLSVNTEALRRRVLDLLQADQVEEALKLCDEQQGPVPAILAAGLRKFLILRRLNYDPAKIEQDVIKAMDDYGVHITGALELHLPILATVSSVAPMLGFLGTVQGMVISFRDIVDKMGETNIVEAAAGGIMTALLTTVLGLVVGIPAFTAFNYFTSVINRFVLQVEESATELIEAVTLQMALDQKAAIPAADVVPA